MGVVPAAAQALAVLQYLGTQAQPTAAAAISRDLDLPRSTTYHLLDTLVRAGFVVHVAEERRYALGVAVYELASGYSRQTSLQRLARLPLAVRWAGSRTPTSVIKGGRPIARSSMT